MIHATAGLEQTFVRGEGVSPLRAAGVPARVFLLSLVFRRKTNSAERQAHTEVISTLVLGHSLVIWHSSLDHSAQRLHASANDNGAEAWHPSSQSGLTVSPLVG
jgi:hypothetical protein